MIERTYDPAIVSDATSPYPKLLHGFEAKEWLEDDSNIAITDDKNNVGLLVYNKPGVYCGHYFFKTKGNEAIKDVRDMITYAFTEFPIELLIGLTPLTNLGAKWMNRKMGFTSQGVIYEGKDACEMVTLTRTDFFER